MKLRTQCFLSAGLGVLLCLCASAVQAATPPRQAPEAAFQGTWYDIGQQIGLTWPEYIADFAGDMSVALHFAGPAGWTPQRYYAATQHLIPQSARDHMQGLAAGLAEATGMSENGAWDLVLTQNMAVELLNMKNMAAIPDPGDRAVSGHVPAGKANARDLFGCSGFAVSSPAGSFLCHNADSPATSGDNIVVLMYWEPDNGDLAYLTIDPPGWADVGFGLNEAGIAITTNAGYSNTDAVLGMYTGFMLRTVMEHAASLADAVGCFEDHLAAGGTFGPSGALVHIMDCNDGSMAKLQIRSAVIDVSYGETSPHGVTFIASANHFTGAFSPDPDYYEESSDERYRRLVELLEQTETFDLAACWAVLSDTAGGKSTSNTISRTSPLVATTFGNVFTAEEISYAMGQPHLYRERYGEPRFVALNDLASMPVQAFTAAPGCCSVILSWEPGSETSVTGYNILRAASQSCDYRLLATVPAQDSTFTDRGLRNRHRYYYKLEAVFADGSTKPCGIVCATPRLKYLLGH